jgi:hypothetical protein
MQLLALSFNAHDTLRLEEIAGALTVIAGAAFFFGALMPFMRRFGQLLGGAGLAVGGVLFVLAVRYGVRP